MEQNQSSELCSRLLPTISNSLAFSQAIYEPNLQLALHHLSLKIPGGIKFHHQQGLPDQHHRVQTNTYSYHQQVFLCAKLQASSQLVVACRGTTTFSDVVQDLKCLPARLSFSGGHSAHWGFAERADSIPLDFLHKLMQDFPDCTIVFTGHSLGGAVASLLALKLLHELDSNNQKRVTCITFGAPIFASSSLATLVTARYRAVFLHVVLRGDFVPKLLPFVSAAQRLVYNDDHWEGFRVACMAVGALLPVVSWIPKGPAGRLLGMVLRAVVPRSLSYDYAGQVLVLEKGRGSVSVFGSERFNAWHARIAMALGGGKDAVTSINEHSIYSYEEAVADAEVNFQKSCCDEYCDCNLTEVENIWQCRCDRLGRVLGVIGRMSRHLHAIQAVCLYTFVCRIFRSLSHRLLVVERAPLPF